MKYILFLIIFTANIQAQTIPFIYSASPVSEEAPACTVAACNNYGYYASTSQYPTFNHTFGADDNYAIVSFSYYSTSEITVSSCTVDGNSASQVVYKSHSDGSNYWISVAWSCSIATGGGSKAVVCTLSAAPTGGVYSCLGFSCGTAVTGATSAGGQSTSPSVTISSSSASTVVYVCTWNGNITGSGTPPNIAIINQKDPTSGCASHVSVRFGSSSETMTGTIPYDDDCNEGEGCNPFWSAIGFSVDLE